MDEGSVGSRMQHPCEQHLSPQIVFAVQKPACSRPCPCLARPPPTPAPSPTCSCGSMSNGQREVEVTMAPFSTDRESVGRPSFAQVAYVGRTRQEHE